MNHSTAGPLDPHPPTESEATPHACNGGWITLGQLVLDPETGEEVEEYALYLCRRCADDAGVLR